MGVILNAMTRTESNRLKSLGAGLAKVRIVVLRFRSIAWIEWIVARVIFAGFHHNTPISCAR